ncbi:MAG: hypothetical protein WCK63_18785 [Betaproteobacteria bacterium]
MPNINCNIFNFENLAARFLDNPYEFFVEKDVQRFAELKILEGNDFDRRLLHQEYPMPVKNKREMTEYSRQGRPHLDMAVLNSRFFTRAITTDWHPNLQDNKASLALGIIDKPWIDCGVEFKFFRFAATKTISKASGLTSSKINELLWDLEKLIHYSHAKQNENPLIQEAWIAIFEEVGSESELPGIYDTSKVNFHNIKKGLNKEFNRDHKKILLDKIENIFSSEEIKKDLLEKKWITSKIENVNLGYCWRKAEKRTDINSIP